ncbi:hypothetical protein ABW19_dt0202405 [Dactylella cylindrospora]|nr:hypothetical protein ABW19_dt0202405 [Dactylella cylindrospora]
MPRDMLSLPDDILLMIMSYGDIPSLCSLRAVNSRFNNLLLTYPRQICDRIIEAHFSDPYLPHYFQELTDDELRYWGVESRFEEYPYHVRQLRRFSTICEYSEAVEDILKFLMLKPPKIRLQHFSIKGKPSPSPHTKQWVLLYFTTLYHHNTLDLSFLRLERHWPKNVPFIGTPEWENAVTWVELVLMYKIWKTVSAEVNVSPWDSPGEIFPLLRTFVRHAHPQELGQVVSSCSTKWSSMVDRTVITNFRLKMHPSGDVCETWTRLYKGTPHDKNIC